MLQNKNNFIQNASFDTEKKTCHFVIRYLSGRNWQPEEISLLKDSLLNNRVSFVCKTFIKMLVEHFG